MTKKEEQIISWLLQRPGYFKKSGIDTFNFYPWTKPAKWNLSIKNFEKVFYEAKKRFKERNQKLASFQNIINKSTIDKLQTTYSGSDYDIDKLVVPVKTNLVNTSEWGYVSKDYNRKYEGEGLWIIVGCVHIPSHNTVFYQSFLKFLIEYANKIKGIIIAGDFIDMEALGSFAKGSLGYHNLDEEYTEANNVLNTISEILPKSVQKIYIYGNHEARYFKYMQQVDNSKLGLALQSPTVALKLVERGYHVFEDWKKSYVTIGSYLDVLHGEFFNIHTAKKHLDTYRRSCLYFHTHRKQIYIEGNEGAFNCGSMANFSSSSFGYASRSMIDSWSNAFAVVNIDKEGYYHVDIPTWMNNKFIFGNKIYSHGK